MQPLCCFFYSGKINKIKDKGQSRMLLSALFITAFMMGFSGAMMPGPLLTVNIHESYRRGFMTGPLLILGHGILELLLIAGLTLGLDALLVKPFVKGSIAIAGGIVLLWMGWGMVRDALAGRITLELSVTSETRGMHPVFAGIIVSLSNPYWLLWWATIGLTFVTRSLQYGILGLTVFFTGHILADLIWYSAISAAVVSGKGFLSNRVYQGVLVMCGIFLLGLAGYFIWSGKGFLIGS